MQELSSYSEQILFTFEGGGLFSEQKLLQKVVQLRPVHQHLMFVFRQNIYERTQDVLVNKTAKIFKCLTEQLRLVNVHFFQTYKLHYQRLTAVTRATFRMSIIEGMHIMKENTNSMMSQQAEVTVVTPTKWQKVAALP